MYWNKTGDEREELKMWDSPQGTATGSDRPGELIIGCGVLGGEDDEFRGLSASSSSSDLVFSTPHTPQAGYTPDNL